MALTREQRQIANAIYRIGTRRNVNPIVLRSAFETGIVESHLRNLSGGDRDSAGWRQERASLYRNPTNLHDSINRYFDEATRLFRTGRYSHAGALAADVQRPAAQYRGRYGQVAGEAKNLINRLGGGPFTGGGGGTRRVTASISGGGQAGGLSVGAPDVSALSALLAQQSTPQAPQTTPLAAPSFSSQSYLKGGGLQLAPTAMPTQPDTGGLSAKLAAIGSMTGQSLSVPAQKAFKTMVKASVPATGQPGTSPSVAVPGTGPDAVRTLIERANRIDSHHYNYEWGGGHNTGNHPSHGYGHGSGPGIGFDCSGAVSRVLGINPRVAAQFESFGQAGRGKHVTIYANGSHTFLEINGKFFGTSGHNPGGGARWYNWHPDPAYLRNFVARHPKGM